MMRQLGSDLEKEFDLYFTPYTKIILNGSKAQCLKVNVRKVHVKSETTQIL